MALDPRIASVLYAADRFETKTKIEDALNKGMIVIADRYVSANQIHQGSKINDPVEKVAFMNWLEDLEYGVFGIPRPDIILYLSVSLNKSMDLMYKRIESKERDVSVSHDVSDTDVSHQHNSRMNALELVEATNNWIKIDCMDGDDILPIEAIQDKIQTALKPHLEL